MVSLFKIKKQLKQALAIICTLAILLCGVPMFASAEEPDIPEAANQHPYVAYMKEGLVWDWSKKVGEGFDWHDCSYIDGGNNINAVDAEYMELDIVSDVVFPDFHIWLSTAYGDSPARRLYKVGDLQVGKNHIVVNMDDKSDEYTVPENGVYFDKSQIKTLYLPAFTLSSDCHLQFCNVAFTSDLEPSPPMNNIFGKSVFAKQGRFWTALKATTNDPINVNDYPNAHPRVNDGRDVDTTEAQYIEFDIYSEVATTNSLLLWLSSANGTDSGRRSVENGIPPLNAGWNHICVNLDSVSTARGGEWPDEHGVTNYYKREAIRGFFLEGTPTTANPEEKIPLNLKFANIAFTKISDMQNEHKGVITTARDGLFLERSYNVGRDSLSWDGGWGQVFIDTFTGPHGSEDDKVKETIDVSAAKWMEFDFYVSADVPESNILIWLSNYESVDAGKRGTRLGELKKGWTHVCLPLTTETFSEYNPRESGWEWDLTALKTLLVQFVTTSTDPEVKKIDYKIGNIAFTVDTHTVTWDVEGELTTETYIEGQTPEYPEEEKGTPHKTRDADTIYEFSGWDPQTGPVTNDITYTAQFVDSGYENELGDINEDYEVNVLDLIVIKKALLDGEQFTDIYDVSMDSDFNGADCIALKKLLFELI